MKRRAFLKTAAISTGSISSALATKPLIQPAFGQQTSKKAPAKVNEYCAFIKFVQDLPYDELAERLAKMGYNGIEATIRNKGYILPENAAEELPKLVEALDKHGLNITLMTSDINEVTPGTEKLMKLAQSVGITRFRMKYYRYDLGKPILPQVNEHRKKALELAAACREIGITGFYQNHSGSRYLGSTIWDLKMLLEGISTKEIAVAFDIRHATTEAGLSWPVYWNIIQSHTRCIYVKDFKWSNPKPQNVPLGEGRVDQKFFKQMLPKDFDGPISIHVEYLGKEDTDTNMNALDTELKKLKSWMG